jgi:ABC-type cobalamin/Fe3+-siderophores transport system ATPase subunit
MDLPSERDLLDLIADLARDRKMAVLFVTHQLSLAAQYARRIAIISKDQNIFAIDDAAVLLTAQKLSKLYGREMEVKGCASSCLIRALGNGERQP